MPAIEWSTIRLQLVGAKNVIAQLNATSGAVTKVGAAERLQGLSALTASERTWLHNQALFTLRRYAYAGTLALTGLAGVMLHWGYTFNQTMASSRAALRPVFSSTAALNAELAQLYNFTKYTPFQFKDMTTSFRLLYSAFTPLGFSLQETNQTIESMVNALAYAGKTSPGSLNRVSTALQHMAFLGHITGQVVNQLARDGLPILRVLSEEMGLTGEQIHKIGTLGIPTVDVIRALNSFISKTPGYMGAARREAMTFGGMMTTLKDNIAQTVGALTFGAYSRGPSFISKINKTFDEIGKIIQRNAAAGRGQTISLDQVMGVFEKHYPFLKRFFQGIQIAILYFKVLWNVIRYSVWPAFKDVVTLWAIVLVPLILIVGHGLQFISHHGLLLRIVMTALIFSMVTARVTMFAYWLIGVRAAIMTSILSARTIILAIANGKLTQANIDAMIAQKVLTRMQALQLIMVGRLVRGYRWLGATYSVMTKGFIRNSAGQFIAMTRFQKLLLGMRRATLAYIAANGGLIASIRVLTVTMLTFLFTNPIGWAILLIAAVAILYWKVKWFRDQVNGLWRAFTNGSPAVRAALTLAFGPIGLAVQGVILLIKYWKQLKGLTVHALGANPATPAQTAAAPHRSGFGNFIHTLTHPHSLGIPGAAMGGSISRAGLSWVGEHGPELMSLPQGAQITPLSGNGIRLPDLNLTAVFKVDGRTLAEITSKHRLDAAARA